MSDTICHIVVFCIMTKWLGLVKFYVIYNDLHYSILFGCLYMIQILLFLSLICHKNIGAVKQWENIEAMIYLNEKKKFFGYWGTKGTSRMVEKNGCLVKWGGVGGHGGENRITKKEC